MATDVLRGPHGHVKEMDSEASVRMTSTKSGLNTTKM
jgi:hypothetical protein